MIVKLAVVALLLLVIGSLGSALFFLIKDHGQSKRTLRALTFRIGLSVAAFLLLMLGYWAGILEPHGISPLPATAR